MRDKKFNRKSFGQPVFNTHPHLLKENEIVQGITLDEIIQRRQILMETIKAFSATNHPDVNKHLIVIPSATKKYISASIPYVFRQNSDFMYLTGCLEQDSILAMEISEKSMKSVLFMRPKDKNAELWEGTRTGHDLATELFAVEEANPIQSFNSYVESFKRQKNSLIWYDDRNSDQKHLNGLLQASNNSVNENPTKFIHSLRWIKSDAEIELMRKTCKIGSDAVNTTIRKSYPGIGEHQIFAEVDYQCRMNNASMLAYPPVVASGSNATTIHYITNTQITQDGDMVLLDAGCEFGSYSSDITRTWPVNGVFTEPQKILYEIVLNVQKDLINTLLNPGGCSLDELFDTMCLRLGKYLQEVNLIPKDKSAHELARAAYRFCPHHVSHYLGMDVHDTPLVSRSNQLIPGNVFTVEPGNLLNV
jgi:Xaa-Pro aminopeptidase